MASFPSASAAAAFTFVDTVIEACGNEATTAKAAIIWERMLNPDAPALQAMENACMTT